MQDRRTLSLADQLYRALGSISANLAEGYSRGTGPDRARFYEYALGSTRESRDWYYKARHVLNGRIVTHRLQFLTQIARLLLATIPQQRGRTLRENGVEYQAESDDDQESSPPELNYLLQNIPLP
jgi:four helix bundle protein